MKCLLCLASEQQDETKHIPVNSSQWQEFNIKSLIDKHLWPIETLISTSWICSACWEELRDFHKFYTRIEEVHYNSKLVLKIEIDPLQEGNKPPKDTLLTTLLEPEIIIGQKLDELIEIKQEKEDLKDNQQDDPTCIEDSSDSNDNEDDSDSDDNLSLIRKVVSNNKPSTRRKCKITEDLKSEGNNDFTEETNALKSKRSSRKKNTATTAVNRTLKPKNLPKINRVDKFLKEHFKMTCDKCQQTYETFRHLCEHYSKEHNEQGYALCCGTKFFNRRLLVDHTNLHLNPECFKCKLCGKILNKRRGLETHLKLHQEKTFACDVCDKKFVRKHKLEDHKLTHMPESEKKFHCSICGKFYASENILTHHQKAVHLNFYARVCEICGETLPDHPTYKKHMERHDGKPAETVKCDQCGLILKGQRCLKIHLELKHPVGDKIDYNCHICSKVSPSMIALKKHIREVHEMGYRFKCTICGKEFKRADNFKSHMSIHTGTPLHRCPWCPKEFNSNGNMHQHRKKTHPVEWEEEQRKKYSGNLPPNN